LPAPLPWIGIASPREQDNDGCEDAAEDPAVVGNAWRLWQQLAISFPGFFRGFFDFYLLNIGPFGTSDSALRLLRIVRGAPCLSGLLAVATRTETRPPSLLAGQVLSKGESRPSTDTVTVQLSDRHLWSDRRPAAEGA